MLERIIDFIKTYHGLDSDEISADSDLLFDLGLTSFEVIEMCCRVEEMFDVKIKDEDIMHIRTVGDIEKYVSWGK